MKLLITGALGHIGSRLILRPELAEYDEVILLDNFSSQRDCSLFDLPRGTKFRVVPGSVNNRELMLELCKESHFCVHLAAQTNAEASVVQKAATWYTNYVGTQNVEYACSKTSTCLIFPSTTSVYGVHDGLVDEWNVNVNPQSPYAESKLAAENWLTECYQESFSPKHVIFRFGTIVGPSRGMRFHTAVNKFIWQACMGQPLTIWRTAWEQKRPYLSIEDCCRVIVFAIEHDLFAGDLFNVVTANYALCDIVGMIEKCLGREVEKKLVDSPIMNQLSYEVSTEKIKALGFTFVGNIEEDINATVDMLRGANWRLS